MSTLFLPCVNVRQDCEPSPSELFTKIGVVGAGHVVKHRFAPALDALKLDRISELQVAICSLEPTSPIDGLLHKYYQVLPGNLLPLDDLYSEDFLDDRTLWIVATPSQNHVATALQLVGMCGRVAIEKPLATETRFARVLRPCITNHGSVFPMDHKLFTAGSLSFLNKCRQNPALLSKVDHIEGVFFESSAFPLGRIQEDGIFDIQWHMFMLVIAAFKHLGRHFEVEVESAKIAPHGPDPSGTYSDVTVCTASCLKGTLDFEDCHVAYEFRQAKAAPRNEKHVQFFDSQNNVLAHVDLSESGWQAHGRMLDALIGPKADMRHTLTDAIALVELLSGVSPIAQEDFPYAFGSLPSFMQVQCQQDGRALLSI
jgi:predicted dehydrogenase